MTPEDRLQDAIRVLGEHFDSVQLFATLHEEGSTDSFAVGTGNWFARYGVVKQWVEKEDEFTREGVRAHE